jgi:hypothetical protein
LIISRIYTISSLICRSPEDSEMYVISSGEDEALLLEQAANTKQSKEIIFFIGFLTSSGIFGLVLNKYI